jgi:prepilin-type N-terminal cleavage/methylation domain-containing protein
MKKTFHQRGFSLPELLVSLAITGVLALVAVTVMVNLVQKQIALSKNMDDATLNQIADRIISGDLSKSAASFNVFLPNAVPADQGGNTSFFDFYPDVPGNALTPLARDFTLSLTGQKYFYILTQDPLGPVTLYNPVAAYTIGTQASLSVAAPLNYAGVNNNKALSTFNSPNQCSCPSAGCGCPYWAPGKLLFFDTPSYLRPLSGNGTVLNMNKVPPRSPIFIGVVGSDVATDSFINKLTSTTDPITGKDLSSGTGADTFFRYLPSVGGGMPTVRVRAVNLVQYSIAVSKTNPKVGQLFRSVYVGGSGAFSSPMLISDNVTSIVFHRDSVVQEFIYYRINSL